MPEKLGIWDHINKSEERSLAREETKAIVDATAIKIKAEAVTTVFDKVMDKVPEAARPQTLTEVVDAYIVVQSTLF